MNRIVLAVVVMGWVFTSRSLGDVEFELRSVSDSGSYFVYSYVLKNPPSSTWGLHAAAMDVSASSGTPPSLPATGPFEDLGVTMGGASAHAEVGPISPTGWEVILDTQSELHWFAPSSVETSSDSVAPGDSLVGLGLRSSYLPGLRRMRYEPTVESCCQQPFDSTTEVFWALPDDYSVEGWSVGPRYVPSEVTIDLLQSQLATVCTDPLWLDDEAVCNRLANSLATAEARVVINDYIGARASLHTMRVTLQEEQGSMDSRAFWMLYRNVQQLVENLR